MCRMRDVVCSEYIPTVHVFTSYNNENKNKLGHEYFFLLCRAAAATILTHLSYTRVKLVHLAYCSRLYNKTNYKWFEMPFRTF